MPVGAWLPGWWCKRANDFVTSIPEEAKYLSTKPEKSVVKPFVPRQAPEGHFTRCHQGWVYIAKSAYEEDEDVEYEWECVPSAPSRDFSIRSSYRLSARRSAAAICSQTRPEWCNRHHVVVSKSNLEHAKAHRSYFDPLPQLRVLNGEYHDIPLKHSQEMADLGEHQIRLKQRLCQFPVFLAPNNVPSLGPEPEMEPDVEMFESEMTSEVPAELEMQGPPPSLDVLLDMARALTPVRPKSVCLDESGSLTGSIVDTLNDSQPPKVTTRKKTKKDSKVGDHSRRSSNGKRGSARGTNFEFARFAEWSESKHKHIVNTWHKLDKDASMSLSKMEFLKGLKELQYPFDAMKLWSTLDRDHTGTVSFIEFAPERACELARMKHWLELQFGSAHASVAILDQDRNGKLAYSEFVQSVKKAGFPPKFKTSLPTLFHFLGRSNEIVSRDLSFLDTWKCPAYLWDEPDPEARQKFQEALVSRHGENPLIAWRKTLDRDSSMRVNYDEFSAACKRLVREGISEANPERGVPALYLAFDHDRSGWFSLKDFDEASYRLLILFANWAKETFGKVSLCVKQWEKEEGQGIGLNVFKKGVKKPLELTDDEVEFLFEGLSLESIDCSHGAFKAGRIMQAELAFLDKWKPAEEAEEESFWERSRGSKLRKSRFITHKELAAAT